MTPVSQSSIITRTRARLNAELGAYYSTLGTREARAKARKCLADFARDEKRLLKQGIIRDSRELFDIPKEQIDCAELRNLSICQLERLYRQHPIRASIRAAEGREHITRNLETRIVNELKRRTPADKVEEIQKEYCLRTHRVEMENMAAILNLPLGSPIPLPASPTLGDREPATVYEREALVEIIDGALDEIESADRLQPLANTMAEIVELRRRDIVRAPEWVVRKLNDTILDWTRKPEVPETDMVIPLLTMAYINNDWSLERKAQRIINRSYRDCIAGNGTLGTFYIAASCSSYVTRYSHRRLSSLWQASPLDRTTPLSPLATHQLTTINRHLQTS